MSVSISFGRNITVGCCARTTIKNRLFSCIGQKHTEMFQVLLLWCQIDKLKTYKNDVGYFTNRLTHFFSYLQCIHRELGMICHCLSRFTSDQK